MSQQSSPASTLRQPPPVPLLTLLSSANSARTRAKVAEAIGQVRPAGARTALVAALADPEPDVRIAAIRALVALGDTEAVPALRSCAIDRVPAVRAAVAQALRSFQAEGSGVRTLMLQPPASTEATDWTRARFALQVGSLVSQHEVAPSTLAALRAAVLHEAARHEEIGVAAGPLPTLVARRVLAGALPSYRLQGGIRSVRHATGRKGPTVQIQVALAVITDPERKPVAMLSGASFQEDVPGFDLADTIADLESRAVAVAVRAALGDLGTALAVAARR